MKKTIVILLILSLVMVLCACGGTAVPAASTELTPDPTLAPTPMPEPTPSPEPQWEPGVVRADYGLRAKSFNRGDSVTVIGQLGDYYIVSDGDKELLVESTFVLLDPKSFESYEAYFCNTTDIYPTAHLYGEPITRPVINTKLQVLSGNAGWVYVEWDGGSGYISVEGISSSPIQLYYGDSGGSGGENGGGSTGIDGGDITLTASLGFGSLEKLSAYMGPKYTPLDKADALIGSDGIEGFYMFFARGDEVKVVKVGENDCQLLLGESLVDVPRWLLQLSSDTPYSTWDGFSEYKATLFKDRDMTIVLDELDRNTVVKVLDALDDCYIVEANGQTAYIALNQVGKEQFVIPYYDYGEGSGDSTPEWTPPVL